MRLALHAGWTKIRAAAWAAAVLLAAALLLRLRDA
jgi:hypothetical protein